jgi:FkbM family methyltransferase
MVVVFDCGGRWGLHRSWQHFQLPLTYVSFEPDVEEAENLTRSAEAHAMDNVEFIVATNALYETACRAKLNLYDERGLSSLFELNKEETYRYGQAQLERQVIIQTTTLDQFSANHDLVPHFLTIDTQGATLPVLKGGQRVLRHILGIRCEVELFPLYKMAPLFDDVFAFLREQSFRLLRLEMCGPGLYGISTEMNDFSVSPWDARPSSCDMIYANASLLEDFLGRDPDPATAEMVVYFVAFCIHNGSGYYGLEVLQRLVDTGKWEASLRLLAPAVADSLSGLVALYLSLPRENVNQGFDGSGAFRALFNEDPRGSISRLHPATKEKILRMYSQKYDPSPGGCDV